jgi:hypothetical protein
VQPLSLATQFSHWIGIDYSGAQHAYAALPGLRLFKGSVSEKDVAEIRLTVSGREHWSRASLAVWLENFLLSCDGPAIVGIDHAFSFPLNYFETCGLALTWDDFLEDFCRHWPMDVIDVSLKAYMAGQSHSPAHTLRLGNSRWRRLAEQFSSGAKSVFHFGVPGAVATSTFTGLPWIRMLRMHSTLRERIHFWPFDGWVPREGMHVIAEVYPSIWNQQSVRGTLTQDQHDARVVALALRDADQNGILHHWYSPTFWQRVHLSPTDLHRAKLEGWILGLH